MHAWISLIQPPRVSASFRQGSTNETSNLAEEGAPGESDVPESLGLLVVVMSDCSVKSVNCAWYLIHVVWGSGLPVKQVQMTTVNVAL